MLDTLLPVGVSPALALLLVAISFLTSAFTAAFGIGGGTLMLGALAGTVQPALIIAVHGLVQVGSQSMADRYTYIPGIGLFIIIAWGLNDLLALSPARYKILAPAAALRG